VKGLGIHSGYHILLVVLKEVDIIQSIGITISIPKAKSRMESNKLPGLYLEFCI
jgi:hypothetical protein